METLNLSVQDSFSVVRITDKKAVLETTLAQWLMEHLYAVLGKRSAKKNSSCTSRFDMIAQAGMKLETLPRLSSDEPFLTEPRQGFLGLERLHAGTLQSVDGGLELELPETWWRRNSPSPHSGFSSPTSACKSTVAYLKDFST